MSTNAKPRILVVEDDVIGALGLQHDLQDLGYEVPIVAGSGEDVPGLVDRWQPSVILAGMPEAESPLLGHLAVICEERPLVLLVEPDKAAELARRGRFGSVAYLARPYTQAQLQGVIEIAVARQRLQALLGGVRSWFLRGLDTAQVGIIVTDVAGRIVILNPEARAQTGLGDLDLAGRGLDEIFSLMDAESGTPLPDPVTDVLHTGRSRRFAAGARLVLRQTRRAFAARFAAPVADSAAGPAGVLIAFHPEGQPAAAPSQDAERLRLLSLAGLLGAVAQDFNNALAVLASHPELLRHYARGPGEFFAPLESIQTSIQQAYLLTGQTMAIGRLGATSFGEVDLRKTTNNLLQFSRLSNGSELEVDIPPGLWKVRGDEVQIIQAMHNLLVRGRDALRGKGHLLLRFSNLPAGSHELPPGIKPAQPGQAFVRMLVADSGEPLPGNDAERLFEPDVILRHGAVGVGLIATKTIVDNHSGWIQVRSEPGVGTIIAVYWPALTDRISTPERFERAPSSQTRALPTTPPLATTRPPGYTAPPPPPPPPPQSTATTGLPVSGPPGSQQRVLIIDDEELVRTSVSGMFKVLGYSAETAWDGAEGIQKFIRARDAGHSFCLVVVDLVVPLGMGAEMAVKEFARLDPNLQVIVTSGYTDHPAVTSFRNYGFRAFLKKPFGLREIKAVLKSIELPAPR